MNILDLADVLQPAWGMAIVRDGATDDDIDATEQRIGIEIPPALKAAYRLTNGEERAKELIGGRYYAGLFFGMNFLSLEQLEVSIGFWRELHDAGDLIGMKESGLYVSYPESAVRASGFNPGRLPFSEESNERHVVIDNAPGTSGDAGRRRRRRTRRAEPRGPTSCAR